MKLVVAGIKPFKLGQIGNGKVVVFDLRSTERIRTGEKDAAVI